MAMTCRAVLSTNLDPYRQRNVGDICARPVVGSVCTHPFCWVHLQKAEEFGVDAVMCDVDREMWEMLKAWISPREIARKVGIEMSQATTLLHQLHERGAVEPRHNELGRIEWRRS